MEHSKSHQSHDKKMSPYKHLGLMASLHLVIMYAINYVMVYTFSEALMNLNMAYMAGMMAAPMVVMMPLMMKHMYPDQKLNVAVYVASAIVFFGLFLFIRQQTLIGDKQFLRSMVPHHSGAVLMCEKASLEDAEIKSLCERIIKSQKEEIEQMQTILNRLK